MTQWGRWRCGLATMLFVTVGTEGFYSSRSSFYGFRPSAGYGYGGGVFVPQYSGYWTTPFTSTGEII